MRTSVSLLVLTLFVAVPMVADQTCKTVDGHFEASVVFPGQSFCPASAPLCTSGRVWGGIQGNYQFVMSQLFPSAVIGGVPTVFFFTGKSTVSLKSDEQVFGTDTGSIDLPPGEGGFASLITFGGGTGTMSTATGQIRLRGHFDPVAGTTSGDYNGSLCSQ
jgi:hypothetical protein